MDLFVTVAYLDELKAQFTCTKTCQVGTSAWTYSSIQVGGNLQLLANQQNAHLSKQTLWELHYSLDLDLTVHAGTVKQHISLNLTGTCTVPIIARVNEATAGAHDFGAKIRQLLADHTAGARAITIPRGRKGQSVWP